MKTNKFLCILIFISFAIIYGQNTNPIVTNVRHAYNVNDGTITVTYDVDDLEQTSVTVLMFVSNDGGETFTYSCSQVSGDIYTNVSTGLNKTIIWDHDNEHGSAPVGDNFVISIIANDETPGGSVCADCPTVDHGGKTYYTLTIGTQCWMGENLNVGTMISGTSGGPFGEGQRQSDNNIIEKYCYDNDEENCEKYGALYQWEEAMQYSTDEGAQGICPDGWHIPTEAEYYTLMRIVGNSNPLKIAGEGSGEGEGTNTSGFGAYLAGICDPTEGPNAFTNLGEYAYFWLSKPNQYSTYNAGTFALYGTSSFLETNLYFIRTMGFSIRCIKD